MKKMDRFLVIWLFGLLVTGAYAQERPWSIDVEGQMVWNSFNEIAIPRESGTLFSLPDSLDVESKLAYRLRLGYQFAPRHGLSLLYAPLELKANGTLAQSLTFVDRRFEAGETVDASYRFNSYRLTYAYTWIDKPKLTFKVGFTAKIRDAEIALSEKGAQSSKTDVGFVPLLHLGLIWRFSDAFHFTTDLDALAAKQGRAEDLFVGLLWQIGDSLRLKAGYRTVEGGADVETVYNFAWLHYLVVGVRAEL